MEGRAVITLKVVLVELAEHVRVVVFVIIYQGLVDVFIGRFWRVDIIIKCQEIFGSISKTHSAV